MNTLDFIASVIKSAAWPCVIVFTIFFFSEPLKNLISSLKEFSLSKDGLIGKFDRVSEKTSRDVDEAKIESAAKLSPPLRQRLDEKVHLSENASKIAEAWNNLEKIVRIRLKRTGIDEKEMGVSALLQKAYDQHVISDKQYKSLMGLSTLRNLTVNGRSDEIDNKRTQDFLDMADAMTILLDVIDT